MRSGFALIAALSWLLLGCADASTEPTEVSLFTWEGRLGDARFAHDHQITSILPLPNGKEILSSSRDGSIRLWDLETGEELRRFDNGGGSDVSGSMVLSHDETRLTARVGYETLWQWDFKTGEVLHRLDVTLGDPETRDPIDDFMGTKLTILSGGEQVLVGYGNDGKVGQCVLWEIATGKEMHRWTFGKNDGVEALCPLPDGQTAWIGVGQQAVQLDLLTGEELKRVSFPPPRKQQGKVDPQYAERDAYFHGLIRGMVLADEGRTVLVYQSDRGFSLIDAQTGEVKLNSKERFQLSDGKYSSNGPWVIGLDGLVNTQTQEFKRLPSGDFTYAWSPDRSVRYGFKGNRIYGFNDKTNEQLFPTKYGKDIPSYVGIEKIYLLNDGKHALLRGGYPGPWWGLWDIETRTHLPRTIFDEKWRKSGGERIHDVHEPSGRLAGVGGSKRTFTVGIDQPYSQAVMLASQPNRPPHWVRFGSDPDQVVGTFSYSNTNWWVWDVKEPNQTTPLSTPSYLIRFGSQAIIDPLPPVREEQYPADPKRLRISADRTIAAMSVVGVPHRHRYKEGDPDIIFWSFPELKKLGGLQVGELAKLGHARPPIDLAFSRVNDDRLWVWRIPTRSTSNAWWKGSGEGLDSEHSETVIGPRLELRETPDRTAVDYELRAAVDLPITVELFAEHPDGQHVLIYGRGKFPGVEGEQEPRWARGFVWLELDAHAGDLSVVEQFELPLVARSMRFAPEGQLLIGTAAGTVELYRQN